jgi:hypothetical protein
VLARCSAGIGEQVCLACTAERDYLGWDVMKPEGLEAVEAEIAKRALAEVMESTSWSDSCTRCGA